MSTDENRGRRILIQGGLCALLCLVFLQAMVPIESYGLPPRFTPTPEISPLGMIVLHASPVRPALWTIVQWQDGESGWHDVKGWQAPFDESDRVLWAVAQSDRGTGPFRWLVYAAEEGQFLAASESFYLPDRAGQVTQLEIRIPELGVGGQAHVSTTGGSRLRLREAPDLYGELVASLSNGTLLSLLGGPVTDDRDLTWWQVRTEEGEIGWCVESVNGVQTLVP